MGPASARLLGLAFAAADLLLEIDEQGKVAFALGAAPEGGDAGAALTGQRLLEVIAPASHEAVLDLLDGARPGRRSGPVPVQLKTTSGRSRAGQLSLFLLPDISPALSCAITYAVPEPAAEAQPEPPPGGLARSHRNAEAFRAMVRERRFELFYQPICELGSGAVHHYEALVRFSAETSPAAVIRMAEDMDLIGPFDMAVAEKALHRLQQRGAEQLKLAVNVSAASLASDDYTAALLRLTAARPEDRSRMMVEVTETAALSDLEAAARRLTALRRVGFMVCIDDFGARSAAFDYLRRLPVDIVKIDGRFVQTIETDARSQSLVAGLVDLCRQLGLSTVAERIETAEQAEALRGLGVTYGQGWLFGRPGPDVAVPATPRTALRRDL